MADTRQVKWSLRRLKQLKTWQLLVLLLLVGFIAATFLRLNNIGMIQRRDAVLKADEAGDAKTTQTRLYDLQRYVASHMNTNMGTIYLEQQYRRDSQKILDTASSNNYENGKPFREAQETCAPRYASLGHYSQAYQQCVINELDNYKQTHADAAVEVKLPKPDEYRHSYVSPLWSPDFAGFSVLVCLVITGVIVVRLISLWLLRLYLKLRHKSF